MNASPSLQIANDSGFPLQIAVERHVADTVRTHGWTVRYSEHSWSNAAEGASGFIDIVLQDSNETTFLVLECKRVRDADWVFLPSDGKARSTNEAKIWFSHYGNGRTIQFD